MRTVVAVADEQIINPPSIVSFGTLFVKGTVHIVIVSAVFTLLFGGASRSFFAGSLMVLGGMWLALLTLQCLREPMLIIREDGLVVRRWGSRLFHIGSGRRYPLQELNPVEVVLRGRGGTQLVVQLSLWDHSGAVRRQLFFFITLGNFKRALARSGYQSSG